MYGSLSNCVMVVVIGDDDDLVVIIILLDQLMGYVRLCSDVWLLCDFLVFA